ncbi:MAG TPA: hypothetical protein VL588_02840, partial [Bdellovibrionota bacterium]|nr:hypothetical protein [Bdellovibrionota bacterium]
MKSVSPFVVALVVSIFASEAHAHVEPDYTLSLGDAGKTYVRQTRTRCGTNRSCYITEMNAFVAELKPAYQAAVAAMPADLRTVVGGYCQQHLGAHNDDFVQWMLCYRDALSLVGGDLEGYDHLRQTGKTGAQVIAQMNTDNNFMKTVMAHECHPVSDACVDEVLLGIYGQGETAYNNMVTAAGDAVLFSAISYECGDALNNKEACRGFKHWGTLVTVNWNSVHAPAVAHAHAAAPTPAPTTISFDPVTITATAP